MDKLPTYEELRAKLESTTFEQFKERFNNQTLSTTDREYKDFKDLCYFFKLKIVSVCAFNILNRIYTNETYDNKIIEVLYTNIIDKDSFIGYKIKIKFIKS